MIKWYIRSKKILNELHRKANDALVHCENDKTQQVKAITEYMNSDYQQLQEHWSLMFQGENFGYLGRHIGFGQKNDFNDIIKRDLPAIEEKLDQHLIDFGKSLPKKQIQPYVAEERIIEISEIQKKEFDTSKLICLLREINTAHNNDSYFTIGILIRTVIDHIPPVFGFRNFSEVANNYKGGKSFKATMQRLNESLKNLADSYLHVQIRKTESLPTINQIEFRAELDALLSEVSRVLQEP